MNRLQLRKITYILQTTFLLLSAITVNAQLKAPSELRVDLLSHTDKVWKNGIPVNLTLQQAKEVPTVYQTARIANQQPHFSWIMNSNEKGVYQTAYQILIASSPQKLKDNTGDLWDSGKITTGQQTAIVYHGNTLSPNTVYYWKVKLWDSKNSASSFSKPSAFLTDNALKIYQTAYLPLTRTLQKPALSKILKSGNTYYDFGKDVFGQLTLRIQSAKENDTLRIHVGEALDAEGRVERKPRGKIRYRLLTLALKKGTHNYDLKFPADKQNTGARAIHMPDYIGEVMPFRHVELEKTVHPLKIKAVQRYAVNYAFDDKATTFKSSDTLLNQVWELSKHTIKATTFTGLYVDGDRERIPYEADALINQLSHYTTDVEFNMAKRSLEFLIDNPTWPTEWSLQNLLVAWNDYLYSGDIRTVKMLYPDLKPKILLALGRADGLISTRTGKQDSIFTKSIKLHKFNVLLQDIIDWPQKGGFGLPPTAAGETDGFVFTDYNSVINAFHYQALLCMKNLALALNEKTDADFYTAQAEKVKQSFQQSFMDPNTGTVKDGEDTKHSSLHANMVALAFGLVPKENTAAVLAHIRTRGMACSVYGTQFLLDALYDANEADYGLQLLTAKDKRSWYNMIRTGSTMTTEAWDTDFKNNQDWNHAWGAAPANIVVRKLMGVEPLSPTFGSIQIKPQPSTLSTAELQLSTLRGKVNVAFEKSAARFRLKVTLPPNTNGLVYLPKQAANDQILMDGKNITATAEGNFWLITDVVPGNYTWEVKYL